MKKRILFYHYSLVIGGAETILINYLSLLSKYSEYEIHLVLRHQSEDDVYWNQIPKNIISHTLLTKDELKISEENGTTQTLAIERLLSVFQKYSYQMIINFNGHLDSFLEKYRLQIPIIRWVHGMLHLEMWKRNPQYYQYILSQHNYLIAINDEIQEYCIQTLNYLGVKNTKVIRLYNPINDEKIRFLSNHNDISDQKYLEVPFLLQVARLDKYKNHTQLINIYYKLKQKGIKEKLYIIGNDEDGLHLYLQQQINRLGLQNDCLLLGRRLNPYPFMKKARLFLHTSLTEGLPTVLIESMVCGTPVIAMDCLTGPKEILGYGEYGKLISLGNEDEFVENTYELLINQEKIEFFKTKLPEATERFTFNKIEFELIDILNNILKG